MHFTFNGLNRIPQPKLPDLLQQFRPHVLRDFRGTLWQNPSLSLYPQRGVPPYTFMT